MLRRDVVRRTASEAARAFMAQRRSLLGYPIRGAAACEMLYGGVRLQHLVQTPFPLHYIKSEALPSPSLDRERHDLGLEMQLPQDLQNYGNINLAIQRQAGNDGDDEVGRATGEGNKRKGLDFMSFMADEFHPDRSYNSSPPYARHDTNNVLALRLFPVNINIRARTEAIRLRTEDCLRRLQSAKLCAQAGKPLRYPLPYAEQQLLQQKAQRRDAREESLYTPSPSNPHKPASPEELAANNNKEKEKGEKNDIESEKERQVDRYAHLHGAPYHPRPSELSLLTRPVDCVSGAAEQEPRQLRQAYLAAALHPFRPAQYWLPMQVMKPVAHVWHPAMRGSGLRGPGMSLYQERLDQKGFGWKRKSRYLWQQDIDTAGFRPQRYY